MDHISTRAAQRLVRQGVGLRSQAGPRCVRRPKPGDTGRTGPAQQPQAAKEPLKDSFLSDIIAFESDAERTTNAAPYESPSDPEELIARATKTLESARAFMAMAEGPGRPAFSQAAGGAEAQPEAGAGTTRREAGMEETRAVLGRVAAAQARPAASAQAGPSESGGAERAAGSETARGGGPGWLQTNAEAKASSPPSMAAWPQTQAMSQQQGGGGEPQLTFKERLESPSFMTFGVATPSASAVLPSATQELNLPLQSAIMAAAQAAAEQSASSPGSPRMGPGMTGKQLLRDVRDNGKRSGVLPDGSSWEEEHGEEEGPNGYWRRWVVLRGQADDGRTTWQECFWESSDWLGLKELGADKSGRTASGAAWHECWNEKMAQDTELNQPIIERVASKWGHSADGDEWEEKWGEYYRASGYTSKWADKWAREGCKVWHERWGEQYDGQGGCGKWTDKWASEMTPEGQHEWGDKWAEDFYHGGTGTKSGETWNVDAQGNRYTKWWGEDHFGGGHVRKHGGSSTGEHWDVTDESGTYFNPIPHFGWQHALNHSPQLMSVPSLPRDRNSLSTGMDTF